MQGPYIATIILSKYWTEQDPVSSILAMEECQVIQENIYDEIETVREAKSQSLVYGAEVASGIKGETLSSSREFSVRASLETIYNPNKFGFWQKDEASGNKEITEIK